jgi:hypothetical protein
MRFFFRHGRVAAVLVAVGLVLAACGHGGQPGTPPAASSATGAAPHGAALSHDDIATRRRAWCGAGDVVADAEHQPVSVRVHRLGGEDRFRGELVGVALVGAYRDVAHRAADTVALRGSRVAYWCTVVLMSLSSNTFPSGGLGGYQSQVGRASMRSASNRTYYSEPLVIPTWCDLGW